MKKILIVDDEKDIRDFTQRRLVREKYEVMTASNGQEALAICKDSHPDLVILDIAIPDIDGYDTCKRIKQNPETKDIPVLFTTGKELLPQGVIKRCEDLGACGYIPKPYTMEELLEKIKEILGP